MFTVQDNIRCPIVEYEIVDVNGNDFNPSDEEWNRFNLPINTPAVRINTVVNPTDGTVVTIPF